MTYKFLLRENAHKIFNDIFIDNKVKTVVSAKHTTNKVHISIKLHI